MKAQGFPTRRVLTGLMLAIAVTALSRASITAQGQTIVEIPYTTPAVFVQAYAGANGTSIGASAYDSLLAGEIGDPEPRKANTAIGTADARATASLNSFFARASTSFASEHGRDLATATSVRELVTHDPQGRGEIVINFSYSGAAQETELTGELHSAALYEVSVWESSRWSQVRLDPTNASNPIVWFGLPYDGNPLAFVFNSYGRVEAGVFRRVTVAHGATIEDVSDQGTTVRHKVTASIRVKPGTYYAMSVVAATSGHAVAVIDPTVEPDPSNPDVTIEFPDTVADPHPQAPLDGITREDLQARGFDPQLFDDLGFFGPPTDQPPSNEPPSNPPAPTDTTSPSTMATPSSGATGWTNAPVTVSFTATDNDGGSGVKEIHASLTGASSGSQVIPGNTGSVQISAEGTTFVSYFAIDNAGNAEPAKIVRVQIDRTAPALLGLPASCTLWTPNHQLVSVANVGASDGLSGLAGPLSIAVTSNERDSGLDDGDLAPDVVINGGNISVRAERAGAGSGRVYAITVTASDLAGNTTTARATCTVPHDYSK